MEDDNIGFQPHPKDTPKDMPREVQPSLSRPLSYNPYDTMPENGTLNNNGIHFGESVDEEQGTYVIIRNMTLSINVCLYHR